MTGITTEREVTMSGALDIEGFGQAILELTH